MDKCKLEYTDTATRHKTTDNASDRRLISRRLSFDELALRDRAVWAAANDEVALREVVLAVKRELAWGDFPRFATWAIANYGAGLARAAGLVNGRPSLVVSA